MSKAKIQPFKKKQSIGTNKASLFPQKTKQKGLILLKCNPQKNRALGLIKLVCSHKRQSKGIDSAEM
ncbi:hypothetical protein B0A79_16615 [Flavobacterium piscis]|uniref:hypothetical protein n=1 Tax=Flavobacterium piscis TaxID=1114874 RepID=UPI000B7AA802|nr:hypothetical protein [Flavobacterium piscis]OXG01662.1 hypothetical protein B0A79_16615 [Flavobacterium piscis]